MQLRQFAERVLFSTSLEEKLTPPPDGAVFDDAPGLPVSTPPAPGRPPDIQFRPSGGGLVRPSLPKCHELGDDQHRGELLHFFANHELLATELMALVLLKFPDAPREFRRGVLKTLKDEQMHTKLYLRRMAECGVHFGDLPVNGFFWNCVADMTSPLDYVARLSLTFEQANLDYSKHFAGVFRRSGDGATASILGRIYEDEISHVGYGLGWFRRWKRDGQRDWRAFVDLLDLPLSAARAKGPEPFNEEGRRRAGLDDDFIRELKIYSRSRGRTPNVYWFNPDGEREAAGLPSSPDGPADDLRHDLAVLPAFLARADDVVLLPELPTTGFLNGLRDVGIALPELVGTPDRTAVPPGLHGRQLHAFRPWAWSPEAHRMAGVFGRQFHQSPPANDLALFSKKAAIELASAVAGHPAGEPGHGAPPLLAGTAEIGVTAASLDELPGHRPLVVKAPFSTAGRDRTILVKPGRPDGPTCRWIEATVRTQGYVTAAPWLERVFDFSLQYDVTRDGKLVRKGVVGLANTPKGQFLSSTYVPRFSDLLPGVVKDWIYRGARDPRRGRLRQIVEEALEPALHATLRRHGHVGAAGVDAFFYSAPDGSIRLHPAVDLNPRFTMGRVAVELARFTSQGALTRFRVVSARQVERGGFPSFTEFARSLAARRPLRTAGRRIEEGTIPLNDPAGCRRFLALLEVMPPQRRRGER